MTRYDENGSPTTGSPPVNVFAYEVPAMNRDDGYCPCGHTTMLRPCFYCEQPRKDIQAMPVDRAELRRLHISGWVSGPLFCLSCGLNYPCPTIQLLDELEVAEARVAVYKIGFEDQRDRKQAAETENRDLKMSLKADRATALLDADYDSTKDYNEILGKRLAKQAAKRWSPK